MFFPREDDFSRSQHSLVACSSCIGLSTACHTHTEQEKNSSDEASLMSPQGLHTWMSASFLWKVSFLQVLLWSGLISLTQFKFLLFQFSYIPIFLFEALIWRILLLGYSQFPIFLFCDLNIFYVLFRLDSWYICKYMEKHSYILQCGPWKLFVHCQSYSSSIPSSPGN